MSSFIPLAHPTTPVILHFVELISAALIVGYAVELEMLHDVCQLKWIFLHLHTDQKRAPSYLDLSTIQTKCLEAPQPRLLRE